MVGREGLVPSQSLGGPIVQRCLSIRIFVFLTSPILEAQDRGLATGRSKTDSKLQFGEGRPPVLQNRGLFFAKRFQTRGLETAWAGGLSFFFAKKWPPNPHSEHLKSQFCRKKAVFNGQTLQNRGLEASKSQEQ